MLGEISNLLQEGLIRDPVTGSCCTSRKKCSSVSWGWSIRDLTTDGIETTGSRSIVSRGCKKKGKCRAKTWLGWEMLSKDIKFRIDCRSPALSCWSSVVSMSEAGFEQEVHTATTSYLRLTCVRLDLCGDCGGCGLPLLTHCLLTCGSMG